jgi:hypothetical protein
MIMKIFIIFHTTVQSFEIEDKTYGVIEACVIT